MPSHANCVVPGCPNRKDKCKWGLFPSEDDVQGRKVYVKRRLCGSKLDQIGCGNTSLLCKSVSFHRLPKDAGSRAVLRKKWLARIPRENTPLTPNSYICGIHFPAGRPDEKHDTPSIFLGKPVINKRYSRASTKGDFHGPTSTESVLSSQSDIDVEEGPAMCSTMLSRPIVDLGDPKDEKIKELERTIEDQGKIITGLENLLSESRSEVESLKFSVIKLRAAPASFSFYTGLTVESFDDILYLVGDAATTLTYSGDVVSDQQKKRTGNRSLSPDAELLLTLMKLRHNFPELDLAQRFSISQSTVSRIFSTWTLCLYHTFKEINIWPSRALINKYMPKDFQDKFPSTRVVIDATEFPLEKPSNPDVQAATWSNYKNRNTLKLLVGVSPNGVLTFLSPLYGSRISDKELTRRSNLLSLLEPGDSIMADRGFDLDSIMPEGTYVNIPPFLDGRKQLEHLELIQTRRIASLRIHVERAIERIKNYNITKLITTALAPLADEVIFVCAFLTLFQQPLVPPCAQHVSS